MFGLFFLRKDWLSTQCNLEGLFGYMSHGVCVPRKLKSCFSNKLKRSISIQKIIDFFKEKKETVSDGVNAKMLIVVGASLIAGPPVFGAVLYYIAIISSNNPKEIKNLFDTPNIVNILGCILISLGILDYLYNKIKRHLKEVKVVLIQSSQKEIPTYPIVNQICNKTICWVSVKKINLIALMSKNKINKAILILQKISKKIQGQREIYFSSISHIPLVAYLGFLLKNILAIFIERNHSSGEYKIISKSLEDKYKPLLFLPNNNIPKEKNEIALCIELSFEINEKIINTQFPSLSIFKLSLPTLERSQIKFQQDIDSLMYEIQKTLEKLRKENPNLKKIHIFYAGETSLIFRIGQIINENVDPEIIVYNFYLNKYNWAISLQKGIYVKL